MRRNYLIRWHDQPEQNLNISSSQIENAFQRTLFQLRFVDENWNHDFVARSHDIASSIAVNTFSIDNNGERRVRVPSKLTDEICKQTAV